MIRAPTGKNLASDPYVLLGRITALSGLFVPRDFEPEVLLRPQDADLLADIAWLDKFSDQTIAAFNNDGKEGNNQGENDKRGSDASAYELPTCPTPKARPTKKPAGPSFTALKTKNL